VYWLVPVSPSEVTAVALPPASVQVLPVLAVVEVAVESVNVTTTVQVPSGTCGTEKENPEPVETVPDHPKERAGSPVFVTTTVAGPAIDQFAPDTVPDTVTPPAGE